MVTDYNQAGINYNSMVWGSSRLDYGTLGGEPAVLLEQLGGAMAIEWRNGDKEMRDRVIAMAGCVDRLRGFLLQVSRIARFAESLRVWPPPGAPLGLNESPPFMLALSARETCTDFESLLFHGGATLDRLAAYVGGNEYRQKNFDRFKNLPGVLGNFEARDNRAKQVLGFLNESTRLNDILVHVGAKRSLRSELIHRRTIQERTKLAFTFHVLNDNQALVFDCESLGYPVLETARVLAAEVPFLVLNSVAVFLGQVDYLPHSAYEPPWGNPTVVHSRYVDPTHSGPRFSVARMNPDGFDVSTEHLRTEILDFALKMVGKA